MIDRSRVMDSAPGAKTRIGDREFDYFGGTAYLGLQSHPAVIAAGQQAFADYGVHAATSRAFYGDSPPVLAVEALLRSWFEVPAALYTPSGYAGAAIVVRALGDAFDHVLVDRSAHYSVIDGAELRGARPIHTFSHCDVADLRRQLARLPVGARPLVMTDGVFALTGAIAPLGDYLRVLREHPGAVLAIDDAHGVGVLGDGGRGVVEHFGMLDRIGGDHGVGADPMVVLCATTSKALGGYGGFLVGSAEWIAEIRRASHWYAGTSPPPTPVAAATAAALSIVVQSPELRADLARNVRRMRRGLADVGFDIDVASPSAQMVLEFADVAAAHRVQGRLEGDGLLVPYVDAYSGTDGTVGLLRVAVFATHEDRQIDRLIEALREHDRDRD